MKKEDQILSPSYLTEIQKKFTPLYDNYHVMDHLFDAVSAVAVSEDPSAIDDYINEMMQNIIQPMNNNEKEKFVNLNGEFINSIILFFNESASDEDGKKAMKANDEIAKALIKLSSKDINFVRDAAIRNGKKLLKTVLEENRIKMQNDPEEMARAIYKKLGDTFVQIYMGAQTMLDKVQEEGYEKKDLQDLLNILLTVCMYLNTLKMQKIITQFHTQRKKMLPGRNDPCHCGSGKKYKKCCMEKDENEF